MASPSSQNKGPVFAIFVSEKGGAERRDVYEGSELSLGRVQGNDVILPKGNVSKRHARLLFRDGRFVVTDLNSTNGTYVNRRRISHATIVRDGDRIYIGDFVLRVELSDESERSSARHVAGAGLASYTPPSSRSEASGPMVSGRPSRGGSTEGAVSRVPLAPRVPNIAGALGVAHGEPSEPQSPVPSVPPRKFPDVGVEDSATPEIHSQREFLATLVQRVLQQVPASELDGDITEILRSRVESVTASLLEATNEGPMGTPSGLTHEQAQRLVLEELLDLGPIGPILEDPLVTAITVSRFDRIHVERDRRYAPLPLPFMSEASLVRVIRRLCRKAGAPLADGESVVNRQLPDGTRVSVVLGDVSPEGAVLLLRRRPRAPRTIEELVRHGVVSRSMATFLHQSLQGRANVLVTGTDDECVEALVNGLCSLCEDPCLYIVGDQENFGLPKERTTCFAPREANSSAGALFRTLRKRGAGRLIVDLSDADTALALLSSAVEGMDGIVGALRAPSLRRALSRLPALLVSKNPGLGASAAREWVRTSFDIGLEVCRLADGRYRVLRVVELVGSRGDEIGMEDIFTFSIERTAAEGAVEGSFAAAGSVPRVAAELSRRGVDVDQSVFTRPPSR